MDHELSAILDELPDKRPRSRLEPYRELIIELRSRKLTFQEIAELLAQKCGVRVTGSGIHDFLRRRNRRDYANLNIGQQRPSAQGPVTRPLSELRKEPGTLAGNTEPFQFDANEPLKLKSASCRETPESARRNEQ